MSSGHASDILSSNPFELDFLDFGRDKFDPVVEGDNKCYMA